MVQTWVRLGPSGSLTVPEIETAVPSCPEYGPRAFTAGGALMITRTTAVAEPPSSSRTVTSTLCVPETVKGCEAAQVPVPGVSVTVPAETGVPSAKSTVQVWLSFVPISVNGAVNATVEPDVNTLPSAGAEMLTAGATLNRVSVVLATTAEFTPS